MSKLLIPILVAAATAVGPVPQDPPEQPTEVAGERQLLCGWDQNQETNVAGYRLWVFRQPGTNEPVMLDPTNFLQEAQVASYFWKDASNVPVHPETNLVAVSFPADPGYNYLVQVTAFDGFGLHSDPSDALRFSLPHVPTQPTTER